MIFLLGGEEFGATYIKMPEQLVIQQRATKIVVVGGDDHNKWTAQANEEKGGTWP